MKSLPKDREKHYQLELGTVSLLTMFAVAAVICGWFFAFGFTLGKHSVPATFSLGAGAPTTSQASGSGVGANIATVPPALTPPAPPASQVAPPNAGDLSAAESNQTPATLVASPTAVSAAVGATAPPAANAQVVAPPDGAPAPVSPSTVAPVGSAGFAVQVFAGSKESDALNLAAALKARQYPVFVLRPAGTDDTFRVQVGPYATMDEAQTMRARLSADGYNAVIKQ